MTDRSSLARVTRSSAQAQANYDRLSPWYDWIAGPSENKFKDRGLAMLAARPGEHSLEIGYGTGYCLPALGRAVSPDGCIYGLEYSGGMQQVALRRLGKPALAVNVALVRGDALHLPLRAASLDGIFLSFVLELFDTPQIPAVLAACHRTLKPGGRLVVVALSKGDGASWPVRIYEWLHGVFPVALDCRPIYVAAALAEAGFEISDSQIASMWGLPVEIVLGRKIES